MSRCQRLTLNATLFSFISTKMTKLKSSCFKCFILSKVMAPLTDSFHSILSTNCLLESNPTNDSLSPRSWRQCLALNAINPIQSFYSNSSCVHQNLAWIEATLVSSILTKLVAPYHVVIEVVILIILTEVSTPTSCF